MGSLGTIPSCVLARQPRIIKKAGEGAQEDCQVLCLDSMTKGPMNLGFFTSVLVIGALDIPYLRD